MRQHTFNRSNPSKIARTLTTERANSEATMNVLIGTPIRDIKEYSTRRWLKSVSQLALPHGKLLMVDNSDTPDFSERVHEYCKEIGFTRYEFIHLEDMGGREPEARLAVAREKIREVLLAGKYTHWFSWECDILLPTDALLKLQRFVDIDIVHHNYPSREDKNFSVGGIGCSLVSRKVVQQFSFTENGGYGQCDPDYPGCYHGNESWFLIRALRAGYSSLQLTGYLKNIEHLQG